VAKPFTSSNIKQKFAVDNFQPFLSVVKKNKFITSAGIYVFGSSLQKGAGFLLIPLYTRFLSPSDYGIVGLATSVQGVLTIILGLGLYGAIARYYYEYKDDPEALRSYISSTVLFLAGTALIISLLLSKWGSYLWGPIVGSQVDFDPYIRLAIGLSFCDAIIQIPLVLYRTSQRAIPFVLAQFSIFLFSTGGIIYYVVYLKQGAEGRLVGDFIANAFIAIFLVILLFRKYFSPQIKWEFIVSSLKFSLPLVPHAVAGWALYAVDRVLLEAKGIPLDQIGLYNLGYQLGMAMNILVYGINQAWSPYYYSLMKRPASPDSKIQVMIMFYVSFVGGICLAGVLFSQEIVKLVASSRYLGAEVYVPPILFGYLLQGFYFVFSASLFYYKRTHIIPLITLVGAAANVILNLLWIPIWGVMGSAWATLVSFAVTFVMAFIIGRRYQKINFL
jgi:O-antigen/teichoic acid export membrane protein